MKTFIFACPFCHQHITCDDSKCGTVMKCPTCYQRVIAPQTTGQAGGKFIMTGQKYVEKALPALTDDRVSSSGPNKFAVAVGGSLAVALLLGLGSYFFGGKIFGRANLTGLLLKEDFSGYASGNLPDQVYRGTGFAANGSWSGWDKTFTTPVGDAGTISLPGLTTSGGKVTVKGDGSNLSGTPDLSPKGPIAAVGLLDAASGTIGGGDVKGTLYLSFQIQATAANHGNEYGGLHLSQGNDKTGVLIGNSFAAIGYSLYYAPTDASFDLCNQNGTGEFRSVDNQTHLLVVRINFASGPDMLTAWLDPNVNADESNQNSATTYLGTLSGDFSFNRLLFRGGDEHPFAFSEIRLGTAWHSVLPSTKP